MIRKKWIELNKEHHPDNLISKGLPQEFIDQSNQELSAINLAYDKIKKLTRGKPLTKVSYLQLVNSLDVAEKDRVALLELTPHTYLGEINKILENL